MTSPSIGEVSYTAVVRKVGTYRSGPRITYYQPKLTAESFPYFGVYSMARGVASPSPASLPNVSFVKVTGENPTTRSGVHDNQQRSYGCTRMCYSHTWVLIVI